MPQKTAETSVQTAVLSVVFPSLQLSNTGLCVFQYMYRVVAGCWDWVKTLIPEEMFSMCDMQFVTSK